MQTQRRPDSLKIKTEIEWINKEINRTWLPSWLTDSINEWMRSKKTVNSTIKCDRINFRIDRKTEIHYSYIDVPSKGARPNTHTLHITKGHNLTDERAAGTSMLAIPQTCFPCSSLCFNRLSTTSKLLIFFYISFSFPFFRREETVVDCRQQAR